MTWPQRKLRDGLLAFPGWMAPMLLTQCRETPTVPPSAQRIEHRANGRSPPANAEATSVSIFAPPCSPGNGASANKFCIQGDGSRYE